MPDLNEQMRRELRERRNNGYMRQDRRKDNQECRCAELEAEVKRMATALEGLERIVRHTVMKGVP